MKDVGITYVSAAEAKPLLIDEKMVYIRKDIVKTTPEESGHPTNVYRCHEYRFTKDEYLALETAALNISEQMIVDQECRLTMLEFMSDMGYEEV